MPIYTLPLLMLGTRRKTDSLHVGTPALGFCSWKNCRAQLDRTADGGCPHTGLSVCLISGLGCGWLGVFDFDARDAVAVHLFDGEAATAVVAGIADGGDLLQL